MPPNRRSLPPTPRELADLPYAPFLEPFAGPLADEGVYDGVQLDRRDLDAPRAGGARFVESVFSGVTFDGGSLRRARLNDVWLSSVRFVGTDLAETDWLDAELISGSWAGVEAFGTQLRRVTFHGCKLDSLNLRTASLREVSFVDCLVRDLDLGGASLTDVRFDGSTLDGVRLREARLAGVDLRGAREVRVIEGVESLRGAVISPAQLIDFAEGFAEALGVTVERLG